MLDSNGVRLIPGFQSHDLNHLILGYGMESEEELCMQAYLIGNGCRKLHCLMFFSSSVLLPGIWITLWEHFKLGTLGEPVSTLSFDECLTEKTERLRSVYRPLLSRKCRRQVVLK